jgi:rhodanese-related sulfurtransferase
MYPLSPNFHNSMHTPLERLSANELDATSLKRKLNLQQVTLVDVRESYEYASEHILGSISVPLSTFAPEQVAQISTKPIVLCCQSGMRSSKATQKLLECGVESVSQLQGGISSWKSAGFKTESDPNVPISLFRQVQIVAGSLVVVGTLLGAFVSPYFFILRNEN